MSNQTLISNTDYTEHVELVGTAHFTTRSLNDVYHTINQKKPKDVAIELDLTRFKLLNNRCGKCIRRENCNGKCEFIGATEALGNTDANIWLIDMSEEEIRSRIRANLTFDELMNSRRYYNFNLPENPTWLWEKGFKEEVMENSKKRIEILREIQPSVWRVLIDERNALMAARLSWIASKSLNDEKQSRVIAFVGAAHVEEITELLSEPWKIPVQLQRYNLSFKEPFQIKRVKIKD